MKTNLFASSCLLKLLLFILSIGINAFSFAQNKVYANNQISTNGGIICGGCAVVNPNGAVGNNENDYSLLKTDIGIGSSIEQVLHFPIMNKPSNLVIGIGTDDNFPISEYLDAQLLSQTTVEIYYEQDGFQTNKYTYTINKKSIKVDQQKTDRATFELALGLSGPLPAYYNRVKISVHGLLGLVNKLRVYYAYYKNMSKCNPPVNPIHYYPFNENTADYSGSNQAFSLVTTNNRNVVYKDSMACKQGISYQLPKDSAYTLQGSGNASLPTPQPKSPRTVSFWAKVDEGGSIDLTIYGEKIKITKDSIFIRPANENHNFEGYFGKMSRPNPVLSDGSMNLYTLDFNNDPTPPYGNNFYQNISLTHPPYYPVDFCLSINGVGSSARFPIGDMGGFPKTTHCTHWAPYYTGKHDNTFSIAINKAHMDEFLIYDEKLMPFLLFAAFSTPPINNGFTDTEKPMSVVNDILTVSPNPTKGNITLDGNILLLDADISVRTITGKEVYHSKFTSKTFELPSSLPGGIYMFRVQTTDKKVYTRKIILTK